MSCLNCKRSLGGSDKAVVQRVRYWCREIRDIYRELSTVDVRKCKDETIRCLGTCRWRIGVFSAPGSCYDGAVFAVGSKYFAIPSDIAAEVLSPFGINGVEPDDAVRAKRSVAPVP